MQTGQARITYLVHSGFSVETARHFFLFDYCPSMDRTPQITAEFLRTKENVYVFASHSHGDHFDAAILKWAEANPAIQYVLSSDIRVKEGRQKCQFMNPYEQWRDGELVVRSFGSTDAGISFWLDVDGLAIFHAGDLNWWHWAGEEDGDNRDARDAFFAELSKIREKKVDIAFIPVDARQQVAREWGVKQYLSHFTASLLVPMHAFGQRWSPSYEFRWLYPDQNVWIPREDGDSYGGDA